MKIHDLQVFWRHDIIPRNITPLNCNYCLEGKYIPTKHIDRCPKCLFIKNHPRTT